MLPNGEGWYYLAVKKISALSRRITSKNNRDFYCSNCSHSFITKNKLDPWKKANKHLKKDISPEKRQKMVDDLRCKFQRT